MDFFYVSILSFIVLVSSFCLQVFLYKYKPRDHEKALPPGSTGWPIIGESIEFFTTGWKGHPEKFIFDRMSKFSPTVFKTSLLLEHVAVFCGAQGNKFLFSNENKLVQGWWPSSVKKIFPATHYNSKGHEDQALKMRNQLLPNFLNPEALHRYVPIMDAVTQHHFATNWDGKKQVVTYELTKDLTFFLACKIFFSIDDPERARYLSRPFQSIIYGIISIPINLPGTAFSRAIKAAKSLTKQLIAIIKQRKFDLAQGIATPTQDVLSHMLLFEDEDGMFMEEHEIADRIIAVLLGAHDTITSASTFIVKYLAELPEIYNQVYKEQMEIAKSKAAGELLTWEDLSKMKYSWNVACEVLRIVPPIQGAFKEAITDFMYDGFSIPKGWKLYWSANSTHKNPELFPEPQKFDPSRFEGSGPAPYTFVPFGGGPRLCPGKEYARLVILVFMHHLVRKYKFEKVIPDEEIVVNLIPSLAKGLPIRLYPHKA